MSDQNTLADRHEASGKVREMYGFGDQMLMVASDRMSAFDVVLPTPIPHKGRVLTAMSLFWFARTEQIVPNHLITADPTEFPDEAQGDPDLAGRSMLVERLTMLPIECVVRGYLVGSGWKDYQATGSVCGHDAAGGPAAGREAARAALHPVDQEHRGPRREHRPRRARASSVGEERYDELERVSIELYKDRRRVRRDPRHHHRRHQVRVRALRRRPAGAGRRGADARLLALLARRLLPGRAPRRRRTTSSTCATGSRRSTGTRRRPAPSIPAEVVEGTKRRYMEAYDVLTGGSFEATSRAWGSPREDHRHRAAARRHPRSAGRDAAPVARRARLSRLGGARRQGVRPRDRRRTTPPRPTGWPRRSPTGCSPTR